MGDIWGIGISWKGRIKMNTEARAYEYFITKDNNCAESTLRAINDEYGLGLKEEDFKLVSAFGAGMGCGRTCGALCGALAAIGYLKVQQRAHATPNFGALCKGFVEKFQNDLGSIECDELKAKYRNDQVRCLKTVELASKAFDEYMETAVLENGEAAQ